MSDGGRRGHPMLRGILLTIGIEIVVAGCLVLVLLRGGFAMNADTKPGAVEHWFGNEASDSWIAAQAPKETSPVPVNDATLTRGAQIYEANCAVCHGGSHSRTSALHKGVYPGAPQFLLRKHAMGDPDGNIFYVMQRGIRFTGMPAWESDLSSTEIWTLVGFLKHMNQLPPAVQTAWQQAPMRPANAAQ